MPIAMTEEVNRTESSCYCGDMPRVSVYENGKYLPLKRVLDLVCAVVVSLLLAVPMAILALLIKLDSPGPVLFLQERMGRDAKKFTIYKFRTMAPHAPRDVAARDLENPEQYQTRLGTFLRKSSIDELPQLWNIIKGDMSFVGYRPVCLTETALNEMRERCGVFAVRPGITGLAQVSGRDNLSIEEKALLDAEYVTRCSLKMDIRCVLLTVKTVLSGEGVN